MSTVVLMCKINSLDTSTGCGCSIARIRFRWGRQGIDRLLRSDILKLVPKKLDYTNRNAWKIEIACALRIQQVARFIDVDDGLRHTRTSASFFKMK